MISTRRSVLAGVGATALAAPARGQTLGPGVTLTGYQSGGVSIPTVLFEPRRPDGALSGGGLVLLHGGGGAQIDVPRFFSHAVRLTDHGLTVAMPNYFAGSGEAGEVRRSMTERFRVVVDDAVVWLAARPGVDRSRLALMGYSRGGHLATEVAVTRADVRAAIGVASAGGLEPAAIRRTPPVLLIYAKGDPVVRPRYTRRWAGVLRNREVPVTLRELDSPRHIFEDVEWSDIFSSARTFLTRHLV